MHLGSNFLVDNRMQRDDVLGIFISYEVMPFKGYLEGCISRID